MSLIMLLGLVYHLRLLSIAQGSDTVSGLKETDLLVVPTASMGAFFASVMAWCSDTRIIAMVMGLLIPIVHYRLAAGVWSWQGQGQEQRRKQRRRVISRQKPIDPSSLASTREEEARAFISQGIPGLAAIKYACAGDFYKMDGKRLYAAVSYWDAARAFQASGDVGQAAAKYRMAGGMYQQEAKLSNAQGLFGQAGSHFSTAADAYSVGQDSLNAVLCYSYAAKAFKKAGDRASKDNATRLGATIRIALGEPR